MKISVFILLSTLLLASCKEEEQPDCGCNAPILFTIPDSLTIEGTMVKNEKPVQGLYENSYLIFYTEPNCINCVHTLVVCNENILSEFNLTKDQEEISVKFSGRVRKVCERPFAPGDYTYNQITLTKIKKL